MIRASMPSSDALIKWMSNLADGTRLRLLRIVERQELGVTELCSVLQLPQSTVSRHLKLLADEGWVRSRRQATTRLYRMPLEELSPAQRKLWLLARQQTDAWPAVGQDELRLAELLRQRREDSRVFFAGAAAQWDQMRQELYGTAFERQALLALLPQDWTVADLGCGTGALTAELASFVAQVIGVDNSPAMLRAARQRTTNLPNVELRQGDLEALPIEDAACDAALLVLVLTYLPEPAKALQQTHRILKPGGKAVLVDLLTHDRDDFRREMGQQSMGFEPASMERLLTESGFGQVRCLNLPPQPKAKGPALLLATGIKREKGG